MAFFKHFLHKITQKPRIYLDFASSTPIDKDMLRGFTKIPASYAGANPSALHHEGMQLRAVLQCARDRVATTLAVHSDEIVFTGNATESDNLAVHGVVQGLLRGYKQEDVQHNLQENMQEGVQNNNGAHKALQPQDIAVMVSALEHSAISELLAPLERQGVQTMVLPATDGYVDPDLIIVPNVKALIVSVMYGNNEIGTVQPITAIAKRIRYLRKQHPDVQIFFHTDATQMPLVALLRVPSLGVDLMTLGATKLYCNKGVGVLYVRRGVPIAPLLHGGGQEFGLRPGTQAVALIDECSQALAYAQSHVAITAVRMTALQTYFEQCLAREVPEAIVTAQELPRLPHITHVAILGIESELLVIELDARSIAVSAKSACKNEEEQESSLTTMLYGTKQGIPYGAVRFSFGRTTTKAQVRRAAKALREVLEKYGRTM